MYPWDTFFADAVTRIFTEKTSVLDIGGGLRVIREKNNRYDPSREWIRPLIERSDYRIMDPVSDYHPDIVGDIHHMPCPDASLDAIICLAVLEHVEDPIRACREMYRVLKPGGYCLIYVPFLFYYHAENGYYGDYWRFTPDSINSMCAMFSSVEIASVRGALQTWIHLSPLGRLPFLPRLAYMADRLTGKLGSKQVSGYYAFLIK